MPTIDFLLIGAMKSGTTTLINYLRRHPEIFIPEKKEVQFFSRDENFNRGFDWYSSYFTNAKPGQVRGEGSTCYSRWPSYPKVPERIFKHAPDIKFLYIVRDPVERAYSHFRHGLLNREFSYGSFEEALKEEPEIIETSKYMLQIEQYLRYFPRERFMFIKFEEMAAWDRETLNEVFNFLEVRDLDITTEGRLASNRAGFIHANARIVNFIRLIRYVPGVSYFVKRYFSAKQRKKMITKMSIAILSSRIGSSFTKSMVKKIPDIKPEDRKFIQESCREDLKQFEHFSGLDLGYW